MTTNTSKNKANRADDLPTEELEQALRKRYGISEDGAKAEINNHTGSNVNAAVDRVANNAIGIITAIIALAILFFVFMAINNNSSYSGYSSSSSSSSKTDWNAYCRDMFPDNDEYSRAAREGCINGGKTTDNLMDGKYNK